MPCILIDQLFIYTFIKKRKEIEKNKHRQGKAVQERGPCIQRAGRNNAAHGAGGSDVV
jgi:hypothetical protein